MAVSTESTEPTSPVMPEGGPDIEISVRQTFGIDSDMQVPAFSASSDYVPDTDETYRFDRETTLAILAGFAYNRRVIIQGYHGTGKSTHIEQVAARQHGAQSSLSRTTLAGRQRWIKAQGTISLCMASMNGAHWPSLRRLRTTQIWSSRSLVTLAAAA